MQVNDINILLGCECSGIVREAFRKHGFNAYSCDIKPAEDNSPYHLQCDVFEAIGAKNWGGAIFFPDCTYLTGSGLHWNGRIKGRAELTAAAIVFVEKLWASNIPHIAIENPVGCLSTKSRLGKPTGERGQIIQPYNFGDDASKKTCIWRKELPALKKTKYFPPRITVDGKERWGNQTDSGQNNLGPSESRAADRARTYPGIAEAMAQQWGNYLLNLYIPLA